jgi:hypothetical protein
MELLFESRTCIGSLTGKVSSVQGRSTLHEDPVLVGDNEGDGSGVSIYGSVIRESGLFRMWYQAWPRDWHGIDVALVGYAESDDGIEWRKPPIDLPGPDRLAPNLTNLSMHAPSVFVDPEAPPEARYRATGHLGKGNSGGHPDLTLTGYYTAHSPDGLDWKLDRLTPAWPGGDVISSTYHPQQRRGMVALKQTVRYRNLPRRAIWGASCHQGQWSDASRAIVPDDFDDVAAIGRGFASGDYYGMGMQAAAGATVGFIWQFRHTLPRTSTVGWESGIFGEVGVSLAYQETRDDCWQHASGRRDFVPHEMLSWAEGGVYTASAPVECGDEHRLYLCGARHSHGWYLDNNWNRLGRWTDELMQEGLARITYASWPKWRLFGFRADPEGTVEIRLGKVAAASRILLNYECDPSGSIRIEVLDTKNRGLESALPMVGESLARPAAWMDGETLKPTAGDGEVTLRLHMERATVWAYEVVPAG